MHQHKVPELVGRHLRQVARRDGRREPLGRRAGVVVCAEVHSSDDARDVGGYDCKDRPLGAVGRGPEGGQRGRLAVADGLRQLGEGGGEEGDGGGGEGEDGTLSREVGAHEGSGTHPSGGLEGRGGGGGEGWQSGKQEGKRGGY